MDKKKQGKKREPRQRIEKEYDQKMVDLARVTRVMKGGKRMSFRACIVIGDRKGRVSYGVAKGPDVQVAIGKAVRAAEKQWLDVKLTDTGTIPHEVNCKFKSALILLRPAPPGTGIKAGGALRVVLDLAGVKNIVAKQLGAKNKINNVKAAYKALSALQETRNPGLAKRSGAGKKQVTKEATKKEKKTDS
jgi:small subunit ribosomal protein S5